MPSTPHHSFEFHLSVADHIRSSWTQEILAYCKTECLWYALKHEEGDNEKLHLHAALVFEIQTATSTGGAKTADNLKRALRLRSPSLRDYLEENPSRYSIVVAPLKSDEFIASYMQKEGELKYYNLPKDLLELKPYFAELQIKPINPEYDKWSKMYDADNLEVPATFESVWKFFGRHMNDPSVSHDQQIKVVADKKKLSERCEALTHFINGSIPEMPQSKKRKSTDEGVRFCPRCIDRDRDAPNILRAREQFCDLCKNY